MESISEFERQLCELKKEDQNDNIISNPLVDLEKFNYYTMYEPSNLMPSDELLVKFPDEGSANITPRLSRNISEMQKKLCKGANEGSFSLKDGELDKPACYKFEKIPKKHKMDDSNIVRQLQKEIQGLADENALLKKTLNSKENHFRSEMKKKSDQYAADLFALQKCKEMLKLERSKTAGLEKELSKKKLQSNKLDEQLPVMLDAFSRMEEELKHKDGESVPQKISDIGGLQYNNFPSKFSNFDSYQTQNPFIEEERMYYIRKVQELNEVIKDLKVSLTYNRVRNDENCIKNESSKVITRTLLERICHGLEQHERQNYEDQIKLLKDNLENYKATMSSATRDNSINERGHLKSANDSPEVLNEMVNHSYMWEALFRKTLGEKKELENKLVISTQRFDELLQNRAANRMELESCKLRINKYSEDLHQEKAKNKKRQAIIDDHRNSDEEQKNKVRKLQRTLQEKDDDIRQLKKDCNSLELDVTQLMNEFRREDDKSRK
jgi:hypothetical protein